MSLATLDTVGPHEGRFVRVLRVPPSIVLGLGLLALLLAAPERLMNDPDTLWHVEIGRSIWAAGAVPWTDTYSHTFAGAPWIAKEWLAQLVLFGAHAAAGWWGVVLLTALSIAGAFAMLHAWLRRRIADPVALAATLLAALLTLPHFLARPHMLVLPIVIAWTATLVGRLDRRAPPPLAFAALMALWANMHGSFPLGLVVAGVLAGEGVLLRPCGTRLASLRRWSLFLAASLAATMLSPYGWHAILVPLRMSGNAETLRFISEWQPLRLDAVGILALGLLAATLVVLARDVRANLFRIALVVLLAYLMIRHVRFVSLFAVLAPLLAARTLAERWGAARGSAPVGVFAAASLAAAGAALALAALGLAATMRPEPAPRYAPEAGLRAATAAGVTGPVFNDYDFGGYLMSKHVPTFVDGRTDQLFLGDFLPMLEHAARAPDADELAALLGRYHVTWALVRSGSPAAERLARIPGWAALYRDDVAAVLVAGPQRRFP